MGTNSRQRGAAKRRQKSRQRQQNQQRARSVFESLGAEVPHHAVAPSREEVEQMLSKAASAQHFGIAESDPSTPTLKALLRNHPTVIDHAVTPWLEGLVREVWEGGWQPIDLAEYGRRKLDAQTVRTLTDAIAAENRRYTAATTDVRWRDQLAEIGAEQWWKDDGPRLAVWAERLGVSRWDTVLKAVAVGAFVMTLPALQRLLPLPGERSAQPATERAVDVDAKVLSRIRGLLAKAESTNFDEEADALTSKAQELMTKYSLDHALVEASANDGMPGSDGGPAARRIWVDAPYVDAKTHLVHVVAEANGCQSVSLEQLGFITILGEEVDLQLVEILSTSLLVQAGRAMLRTNRQVNVYGQSRTRSYRRSFLFAYGARIGERLREAREATQASVDDVDRERLLPVLARRDDKINELVEELFPDVVSKQRNISNPAGWAAGRAAADQASLNARSEVRR